MSDRDTTQPPPPPAPDADGAGRFYSPPVYGQCPRCGGCLTSDHECPAVLTDTSLPPLALAELTIADLLARLAAAEAARDAAVGQLADIRNGLESIAQWTGEAATASKSDPSWIRAKPLSPAEVRDAAAAAQHMAQRMLNDIAAIAAPPAGAPAASPGSPEAVRGMANLYAAAAARSDRARKGAPAAQDARSGPTGGGDET